MLARNLGMFPSKSKTTLYKPALSFIQNHPSRLMIEIEKEIKGVGRCIKLINNHRSKTDIRTYRNESWEQFQNCLLPNHLHIYVHAARFATANEAMVAGHVASFITDPKSNIIEETVMSLQNGDLIKDQNGYPIKVSGLLDDKEREELIYTVEFASIQDEVSEFLGKAEYPSHNDLRHLISIPINEEDTKLIREFVSNTIALYGNRYFQIFDGKVNGEFHKALNCCLGFYSDLGIKGKRSNPSPQLVTWSYLKFIFDERITKNIINGTILDDEYLEDTHSENTGLSDKLPKLTGEALRDLLLSKSGLKENSKIKADDEIKRINYKP